MSAYDDMEVDQRLLYGQKISIAHRDAHTRPVENNARKSRDEDLILENRILTERERIVREIRLYREITEELEQRIEALEAELN